MRLGAGLFAFALVGGCLQLGDAEVRAPDARIVSEYAAVRSGAADRRSDTSYHFVRDGNAVKVTSTWPRVVDDEAYVFADDALADNVNARLRADAAVAGLGLRMQVVNRVVYLHGRADDIAAARAIYDALSVPAVGAVYAQLDRP
ncbi:MAG TPA: BON domain-containing protein [Polyangia bacterium]|nr:BON domain-containing protein [Polyangia bacterium]